MMKRNKAETKTRKKAKRTREKAIRSEHRLQIVAAKKRSLGEPLRMLSVSFCPNTKMFLESKLLNLRPAGQRGNPG
jgi:hypothetical protein